MEYKMIGNLLKYMCAKNYHNRWSFDKTIAKMIRCSFLPHVVVLTKSGTLELGDNILRTL